MRAKPLILTLLLLAPSAYSSTLKAYQDATLQQMDSVPCGTETKSAKKTRDVLCQEYVLQTERTTYRIRQKDEKHSVLLPVGEPSKFRLEKTKLLLRIDRLDAKEREFIVVSVKPRGDDTANASPARVNHLQ